jgi:hypothetical protein
MTKSIKGSIYLMEHFVPLRRTEHLFFAIFLFLTTVPPAWLLHYGLSMEVLLKGTAQYS